jgi:AraC-like DNA-binding protein
MTTISTDTVLAHERAEFWADLVSRHVTPMRIEPTGERALRGEIETRLLGDIGVAQVSGMGVQALHSRGQVARAGDHRYAACVHLAGEARLVRHGAQIALKQGDVFVTDSRDEFTLDLDQPWRHLVITLPTELLDSRVTRPELTSKAVLRDHPLVRLWASHLATGFGLAGSLSSSSAILYARHALELLAQLLEEYHHTTPTQSEAWRAAMYLEACQVIALKYGQPDLRPEDIAKAVHVSTRTLARLFAANGESVMRRVFDERIRQAARLLSGPQSMRRSITEVGFACGFNDASHFGRVFAARLGSSPADWRRRERDGDSSSPDSTEPPGVAAPTSVAPPSRSRPLVPVEVVPDLHSSRAAPLQLGD